MIFQHLNSIKVFIIRWSKTFLIFIISHFLCPVKWIITTWYWFSFFALTDITAIILYIPRRSQWRMFFLYISWSTPKNQSNSSGFCCSIYIILNFLRSIPFGFANEDNWMNSLLLFCYLQIQLFYWLYFLKSTFGIWKKYCVCNLQTAESGNIKIRFSLALIKI